MLNGYDFLHVSFDLFAGNTFIPRIPKNREFEENDTIPRVSVAKHLDGCLTGIPNGNLKLHDTLAGNYNLIKVYGINLTKLGLTEDDVIREQILYENNYVVDAYLTDECWITKPFTVSEEDIFYLNISYWESDESDDVPYQIRLLADTDYGGNIQHAWNHFYPDEYVPAVCTVDSIEYQILEKDSIFEFIIPGVFKNDWLKTLKNSNHIEEFEILEENNGDFFIEKEESEYYVFVQLRQEELSNLEFKKELLSLLKTTSYI